MEFYTNHPILFVLAGVIIAAVLAQSVFFLIKAWKRGTELGMDKKKLRKIATTAAVFTIAPAVAIVISVLALSKKLGLALPWLRLSVVGSLSYETVAAATRRAISIAEKHGVLRSFDPNLRPPLWKNLEDARKAVWYGLAHCDILKISDNEIQWLTGEKDYTAGVAALRKEFSIPLILVSMGPDGSRAYTENLMVEIPAHLNPNTIETTGAGDTFCACVLHDVLENGLTDFSEERLKNMLSTANAAASIVTTRRGALRVMPMPEEIKALLSTLR